MRAPIGFIVTLAVLVAVASGCTGNSSHTITTAVSTDTATYQTRQDSATIQKPRARNQMTDSILAQITSYYRKKYGSDSVRMDITRSDTIIELDFADTATDTDQYHGTLLAAYISLVTDINPILTGDMNGDGVNDMLVTVHTEGGGGGGNMAWDDHFLFLAGHNGGNNFVDVKSDPEIMNSSGYFIPKEIANQVITGVGNGYAESDGHCCPSLYFSMHVRFTNGRLKTMDKTAIAKPKDFE